MRPSEGLTLAKRTPHDGDMFTPVSSVAVDEPHDMFSDVQIYKPHRAGIPNLPRYIREVWKRREFVTELSRSMMVAQHSTTFFGRAWLILNPLLLAAVYFFLVYALRGGQTKPYYFADLTGGLFMFYFVSGAMQGGAGSIVGGGRLVMNTAFPRLLLTIAAVRTAFMRFLPTLPVFYVIYLVSGLRPNWHQLLAIPAMFLIVLFGMGAAAVVATLQVYFRDTATFMAYFIRIWLYISPVLWPWYSHGQSGLIEVLLKLNPLYSLLGVWNDAILSQAYDVTKFDHVMYAPLSLWALALAWSVGTLVVGCLYFISREREFAVRL